MRFLICGSRLWIDSALIWIVIATLPPGSVIIHGCANGADKMAAKAALHFGFEIENPLGGYPISPGEWKLFGRGAGAQRNRLMIIEGHPDRVIAFHLGTNGTQNMIDQAREFDVPTEVWHPRSYNTAHNMVLPQDPWDRGIADGAPVGAAVELTLPGF
jgi:hypothetical protein